MGIYVNKIALTI